METAAMNESFHAGDVVDARDAPGAAMGSTLKVADVDTEVAQRSVVEYQPVTVRVEQPDRGVTETIMAGDVTATAWTLLGMSDLSETLRDKYDWTVIVSGNDAVLSWLPGDAPEPAAGDTGLTVAINTPYTIDGYPCVWVKSSGGAGVGYVISRTRYK